MTNLEQRLRRLGEITARTAEAIIEDTGDWYDNARAKAIESMDGVAKKSDEYKERFSGTIMDAIDKATDEEMFRDFGSAVMANLKLGYTGAKIAGKQGMDVAKIALEKTVSEYDSQMNDRVADKPEAVGFWDGFVNAYLNRPAERRPRSKIYTQHVTYGKVAGWATWAVTASVATLPRAVLTAVPVVAHAGPKISVYLHEKVDQAKVQMD